MPEPTLGTLLGGGFVGIVSFAGGWVKTTSAYGDLTAWRAAQGVTMQSDINLGTSLTSSLSDAMVNQAQGAVSLASQAAAKRLGISLPGSTTATGGSSTTAAANPASSVKTQRVSSVVNSQYGNDYAAKNITGALAALDAIVAGTTNISAASAAGAKSLSSYGSNYAAQNITGYLANLDRISAATVNVTA